ncbi:MAG TPA: PA14 domain-containing protein, partial [Microbacteriaceae bacterium]|nr:PA14 domain-containing protein [Microbacteriaceae bacterium]
MKTLPKLTPATALVGATMSVTTGTWDGGSGCTPSYSYLWYAADLTGLPVTLMDGGSTVTASSWIAKSAFSGKQISVVVTASTSTGSASTASTTAFVGNTPPGVSTPVSPGLGSVVTTPTPMLASTVALDPDDVAHGGTQSVTYIFDYSVNRDFSSAVTSSTSQSISSYLVPAALSAGTYYWRVRVSDGAGGGSIGPTSSFTVTPRYLGANKSWPTWTHGGISVNLAGGNVLVDAPGPSYPTKVGSLALSATYNSQSPTTPVGPLGAGWTLNIGDGSAPTQLVDTAASGGGETIDVTWADATHEVFVRSAGSTSFVSADNRDDQLVRDAGAGSAIWYLTTADGTLYRFELSSGTTYTLTSVEIPNANGTDLAAKDTIAYSGGSPTSVTSGSRSITLNWSCSGALMCATGSDGVVWKYIGVSGATGQLASVIRVSGSISRTEMAYAYSSGLLSSVRDANDVNSPVDANLSAHYAATHSLAITYGTLDGLPVAATVTDGPITGPGPTYAQTNRKWTFTFADNTAAPQAKTNATVAAHKDPITGLSQGAGWMRIWYHKTTVLSPMNLPAGPVTSILTDGRGYLMQRTDQLNRTTQAMSDDAGHVVWTEDAYGAPTDNTWDSVDGTLTSTTTPDPQGTATAQTTNYGYDEQSMTIDSTNVTTPLLGLQAQWYSNATLTGRPTAVDTSPIISYAWNTTGPPELANQKNNISLRLSGDLNAPLDGFYYFSIDQNGGARLSLDGQDVVALDNWTDTTDTLVTHQTVAIYLTAGKHRIVLEYFNGATGGAQVDLNWATPGAPGLAILPGSFLLPAYGNQTSIKQPSGRTVFHHYQQPWTHQSDYQLVVNGTTSATAVPMITSYDYDAYGRMIDKYETKANLLATGFRTLAANGTLSGPFQTTGANIGTNYLTTWQYYASGATNASGSCAPSPAVDQGELLQTYTRAGISPITYIYDSAGRTVRSTQNSINTCSTFDADGRLTQLTTPDETSTYTYDPDGQQVNATHIVNSSAAGATTEYDETGAVRITVNTDTGVLNHRETYTYDADGNQIQSDFHDPSLGSVNDTITSTFDAADQKTGECASTRCYSFAYDDNGALKVTIYPNQSFVWNVISNAHQVANEYIRRCPTSLCNFATGNGASPPSDLTGA